MSKWKKLYILAEKVAQTRGGQWQEFAELLHFVTMELLRSPRILRWNLDIEDQRSEIFLITLGKLRDDDYRRLREFFARADGCQGNHSAYFKNWLRVLIRRFAIDHLRRSHNYIRTRDNDADDRQSPRWRFEQRDVDIPVRIDPLPRLQARRCLRFLDITIPRRYRRALELCRHGVDIARISEDLGVSRKTASQLLARARDRALYRPALELWSRDCTYIDIARRLCLGDHNHAQRLVRSATRILRNHFRPAKTR